MSFQRYLKMALPAGQSAFLWGARKTGKSTLLASEFSDSIFYDLLKTDEYARLLASPHLLREELLAASSDDLKKPVIIDEVQKIPALLNEVHWLIENKKIAFILCGSSARKLKRGAANLLGGRAWKYHFYPLVYPEVPNLDLLRVFKHGLLPSHYLSEHPDKMLRAYTTDYLAEEIQAEGLVRNLPKFAKFMELVGYTNGQMLNYSNIARDVGVDAKTIKEYYQILADTLIGYYLEPFHKKVKRDLIQATPKFYLFDVGVANYLQHRQVNVLKGDEAGLSFEHYLCMELTAYLGLNDINTPLQYWRSKTGLEVDFVLHQGRMAVEAKLSADVTLGDVPGLVAFVEDYQPTYAFVVCQAPRKRLLTTIGKTDIIVLPWQEFLAELWGKRYA
ncbi:MAG TPA: AAA family ATPase [Gammaproteobacteria bacterium]|nr:AAA family ATPase [Gammaproteobacteria bacterium]